MEGINAVLKWLAAREEDDVERGAINALRVRAALPAACLLLAQQAAGQQPH
jgi:hypothetical protein